MISIFTAKTVVEAELIIGMLRNNGIVATRESHGGPPLMEWYTGTSTYMQDILVDESDYERARELSEAFFDK